MSSLEFRLCVFAERQIGLASVAGALKQFTEKHSDLRLTWVDVTYVKEPGAVDGLFWTPHAWRGVLRGFLQTGGGLRRGPYDALLFLTHNPAVLRQLALHRTATSLWTDVTPVQLDRMAEAYDHPLSSRLVQWLKHAAVSRTFSLARRCIGWSEWARRSFVRDYGVAEERTAVVSPGVDLERFRPAPKQAEADRPFRLLFVGGNFQRKGGSLLLEAFRSRLRGTCELAIVTRDYISEEPGIRVHRGIDSGSPQLLDLYAEANAFVLPTLADCHSIASLEAMACGLPVVTTRVGAIPEIVEDGSSGYLLEAGDGASLAQVLEVLANDRARAHRMGMRGRELVERKFDGRRTADLLVEHARAAAREFISPVR